MTYPLAKPLAIACSCAVAAVAVFATGRPGQPAHASAGSASSWVLVATSDRGRALVVGPQSYVLGCVGVVAKVIEHPESVSVTLQRDRSRCGDKINDNAHYPTATLRLAKPLAGREIQGPRRVRLGAFVRNNRASPPRLIGLQIKDAREILDAWQLNMRVKGTKAKGAYVTDQYGPKRATRNGTITVHTAQPRR